MFYLCYSDCLELDLVFALLALRCSEALNARGTGGGSLSCFNRHFFSSVAVQGVVQLRLNSLGGAGAKTPCVWRGSQKLWALGSQKLWALITSYMFTCPARRTMRLMHSLGHHDIWQWHFQYNVVTWQMPGGSSLEKSSVAVRGGVQHGVLATSSIDTLGPKNLSAKPRRLRPLSS